MRNGALGDVEVEGEQRGHQVAVRVVADYEVGPAAQLRADLSSRYGHTSNLRRQEMRLHLELDVQECGRGSRQAIKETKAHSEKGLWQFFGLAMDGMKTREGNCQASNIRKQ